ncbi:glycosylphosphatidylinositol-anchored high density lipoprotein-binding protein 1 isoform X1 [Pteropus alecto]|uniref:glycosylphosphatidylinositol-anchored high density lipoprotein-binding protein 1 isoform X1 n=1 Tax=Pteropus alecto TaxID=9402 RepID=UPI000D53BC60|nr:glycosylphosphatidylinositol-anchored high density lipoprotein-binding protein 1 isoform X1 [Pteropus alecto]
MKVLAALLLALLLCRQPGRGRAQDEEDDGEGVGMDSYDDDEDEDREAGVTAGGEPPRCFACQSLHSGEGCSQIQSCPLGQTVCKTLISQGDTGELPPQGLEDTALPPSSLSPPLQRDMPSLHCAPTRVWSSDHLLRVVCGHVPALRQESRDDPDDRDLLPDYLVQRSTVAGPTGPSGQWGRKPPGRRNAGHRPAAQPPPWPPGGGVLSGAAPSPPRWACTLEGQHPVQWPLLSPPPALESKLGAF